IGSLISGIGEIYEDEIQCILDNREILREIELTYANKVPIQRYIDFNQGMDARELTESKMKILSKLPIRPFRIAYDNIKYTDIYIRALRLANSYDAPEFSNYILYNHKDRPEDLYKRIEINITLSEEFGKHIYSFPMKYEPVDKKNRGCVGSFWNRHYLNNVKAILNVTKGVFGGNRSFFEKAFGKNVNEFLKILSMPKELVTYRYHFEDLGITRKWEIQFDKLELSERINLLELISNGIYQSNNKKINRIMSFYTMKYENTKTSILAN
ncbi:MAG: hypothetical protein M1486_01865, partial [Gammaproteobacteria bacterium]|nr:hypothetical protein [Gammaproteobacteria bacterium]